MDSGEEGQEGAGFLMAGVATSSLENGLLARPLNLAQPCVRVCEQGGILEASVAWSAAGPFIKLGPLRNIPEVAEKAGVASAGGLVIILTLW